MTKETGTEMHLSAEWFDYPRGGGGRAPGRARSSILSNGKGDKALALKPDDVTSTSMAEWRFVDDPKMRANKETGIIVEVKLLKAERGLSVRRYRGTRPQVPILLRAPIVVTVVDHDGDYVDTTTCRVENDGSIVFTLPEVIKGKDKYFKITRAPTN
jgi:hypothetical protein